MFVPTTESLIWVCIVELALYLATGAMLIATRFRHERRMGLLGRLETLLARCSPVRTSSPDVNRLLAVDMVTRAPAADIKLLASEAHVSRPVMAVLAQSRLMRVGSARVCEEARSRRWPGGSWRRIAALRTLAFADSDQVWDCLTSALANGSYEVKAATVTLLGQLGDRRSASLLIEALRAGSFARSRVAASLEAFPLEVGDLIAPLLSSDDAQVRFWATTLMARYTQMPNLVLQLVALTHDPEPTVRKAAIDAIVATSAVGAMHAIRVRLADKTPFVRAHAARSLGRLHGASQAPVLLPLLADMDWTVRDAVKETLTAMGEAIGPTVLPFLSHPDEFARNGAAEVLQNTGVFERLVTLEAKGPSNPARARTIHLLAHAGGARMWESVVERLDIDLRARARQLLVPTGPVIHEVA